MHTHSLAILLFLLVSSILELPNLISSVEAKKSTTSNGGVFKFDLIHRDSPLSPYHNCSMTPQERLKRLPLGSISRGHNIQLSSAYYGTSDVEMSDLLSDSGGYLMKIAVGTPEVEFLAIADTGSNLVWVQCTPCDKCSSQKSPLFDPTKSSTFQAIPCNSSACSKPDLSKTSCPLENITDSSPCHYQYNYGSIFTSGILAMETISLPSSDANSLSLPSTVFGCGMDQSGLIAEGIIGLGMGPSSLISQLGPNINYKFSYCLPPLDSGVTGKLAFGANVTGTGVVSTPLSTGIESLSYNLTLDGISVGDENVPTPAGLDVIIDSGTTYTMLPATIYGSIKTTLETAIGLSKVSSPVKFLDLCYNSGGQFNPPDVVFHFRGADVVLKAINMFRTFKQYGVTCLAMVATDNVAIFGNIAQVNFEVSYDLQAKQVSFLPADCTNY